VGYQLLVLPIAFVQRLRRVGSQFKDEMLCERITALPLVTAHAARFTMVEMPTGKCTDRPVVASGRADQ
jgi:hypothetical protein